MVTHFDDEQRPLAVITGASSGIGYSLAKVFAMHGYDLIVCAEERDIHEAANAFRALGGDVESVQCDLATYEGVEKLYGAFKRPVDVLVLNAGVGVGGHFHETDLQKEINLINLNITSTVHLTKRVLPEMLIRGAGKILFTSSIAAEMPGPYYAVYAASKAFVQSFSEAIRAETKEKGITVTALQPGATDTEFFARADMLDTKAGQADKDDPDQVAQQGYDALMAGKDHVVAGSFMNKVQATVGKLAPESVGARLQGSGVKPLDKGH